MAEQLLNAYKSNDAEKFEEAKKNFGGKLALDNAGLFCLKDLKLSGRGTKDDVEL